MRLIMTMIVLAFISYYWTEYVWDTAEWQGIRTGVVFGVSQCGQIDI